MFEALYNDPTYQELANTRIDIPSTDGWKSIPIRPIEEPLVAIDDPTLPFFSGKIYGASTYYGKLYSSPYEVGQLAGALISPFTRSNIAKELHAGAETLPPGVIIIAHDLFRSVTLQQSLFDSYFNILKTLHLDWLEDALLAETQKFVSLPSTDPTKPSPHNTGGSLDLELAYLDGGSFRRLEIATKEMKELQAKFGDQGGWGVDQKMFILQREVDSISRYARTLPFGTPFDWGSNEASWDYLESKKILTENEVEAQKNRRFMGNFMRTIKVKDQSVELYEYEYWHFNVLNQMAAAASRKDALLGAASLSWQNEVHELIMKQVHTGMINDFNKGAGRRGFDKLGLDHVDKRALYAVNKSTELFGNPRRTNLQKAAIIAPSV